MSARLPRLDRRLVLRGQADGASALGGVELPPSALLELPEKVVQFGTGAFLRGFVESFIDDANRRGAFAGRVVAVASTEHGGARHHAMAEQDGLYTLMARSTDGSNTERSGIPPRVIASISRVISAASDWDEVLACARSEAIELVFSNTTEVGIARDDTDAVDARPPRSYPGKLTRFLYERARTFDFDPARGVVVIPCELLEDNGGRLRAAVIGTAEHWGLDHRFVSWLDAAVPFCNTLVDRIVPSFDDDGERARMERQLGFRDALLTLTEPYRLFAIEADERARARLRFATGDPNIILCDDVSPYRERKLRLLNGPHSIMACIGLLNGERYVSDAMDGRTGALIRRAMLDEIAPCLDAPGAREYAHDVIGRFGNRAIRHPLLDIMLQGTTKMRVRVVPSIVAYAARTHAPPPVLTLGLAALLLCVREMEAITKRAGRRAPADDGAARIRDAWTRHAGAGAAAHARVTDDVISDTALWQTDLSAIPGFAALTKELLELMMTRGVSAAIDRVTAPSLLTAAAGGHGD